MKAIITPLFPRELRSRIEDELFSDKINTQKSPKRRGVHLWPEDFINWGCIELFLETSFSKEPVNLLWYLSGSVTLLGKQADL